MRFLIVSSILFITCGCTSEEERFQHDMWRRYETACDRFMEDYASGDVVRAKAALGQIVSLSEAELQKATYYWRFHLLIAYSQARLAVIAEGERDHALADQLFASASTHMVAQNRAIASHSRRPPEFSDEEARFTPARWRKNVALLDKKLHLKWNEPNKAP